MGVGHIARGVGLARGVRVAGLGRARGRGRLVGCGSAHGRDRVHHGTLATPAGAATISGRECRQRLGFAFDVPVNP